MPEIGGSCILWHQPTSKHAIKPPTTKQISGQAGLLCNLSYWKRRTKKKKAFLRTPRVVLSHAKATVLSRPVHNSPKLHILRKGGVRRWAGPVLTKFKSINLDMFGERNTCLLTIKADSSNKQCMLLHP
ncbi:unnamed protein product [Mesocestoides corti]|uniref:Uncharacterized protein n=1 Tax=Mesocestoides corti TaxID=53468 RepID=A0A0R3UMG3_MESCO|nr:unnamed protein product [Mesocestoides corti]